MNPTRWQKIRNNLGERKAKGTGRKSEEDKNNERKKEATS